MANRVYDRLPDFGGGVNSFIPADKLEPNQSQLLQNIIVEDNYTAITRAGADSLSLVFDQTAPVAHIQGLCWYNTPAVSQLLMAKAGNLYIWNGAAWALQNGFALASGAVPFVCEQGVDTVLISDGVSHLQIWNGFIFQDCGASNGNAQNPNTNPPIGATILVWTAGRMFASGIAATPDTIYCSNLLNFGPGQWNSNTQSFRIGDGDGEAIQFIGALQNFNIAVLKDNSVWLVNVDPGLNIQNWSALPLGQKLSDGVGCVGRHAACVYENDLMFMSRQGVYSVQRMQAAVAQYQLTAPLSEPIQPLINRINWSSASGIVAIKYQQLAIFFVPLDNSTYNNYALVWNGILGEWTGYFTGASGWTPWAACTTLFNGNLRLVMGNNDGTVTQWKDFNDATLDSTYLDNGLPIVTTLYTRAMTFGNLDLQKKLKETSVLLNTGNATITFSAVLDFVVADTWTNTITPGGPVLPVLLPFQLGIQTPSNAYRSLEGLPYCVQFYLQMTSTAGWFSVLQCNATAWYKPPPRAA